MVRAHALLVTCAMLVVVGCSSVTESSVATDEEQLSTPEDQVLSIPEDRRDLVDMDLGAKDFPEWGATVAAELDVHEECARASLLIAFGRVWESTFKEPPEWQDRGKVLGTFRFEGLAMSYFEAEGHTIGMAEGERPDDECVVWGSPEE